MIGLFDYPPEGIGEAKNDKGHPKVPLIAAPKELSSPLGLAVPDVPKYSLET